MSITPDAQFGPFDIGALLGEGGMGQVYRAKQSNLGREVALKVLTSELAANPEGLRRFEQEARSASALNHPNIVSIYDIGKVGDTAYIAMELVEGKTLRELLEAGPLAIKKILQVSAQIADGLAKAHAVGIVHRDLKPENIMVTRDGLVKILDFGLARVSPLPDQFSPEMATLASGTNPGLILGTVGYMSPEQAKGQAVDFRSDQFSLGTVIYEMCAGRRPFRGDSSAQTMAAIIEQDPEPVGDLNPQTPPPLRWLVERCLQKDADDRYASTRDLARELQGIKQHLSEMGKTSAAYAVAASAAPRSVVAKKWFYTLGLIFLGAVIGAVSSSVWFHKAEAGVPILRTITFSGSDYLPSISPDGHTVAFVSRRDGNRRLWLKQFIGGGEVPLTTGMDTLPRFSPDGSMILFTRREGDLSSIYQIPMVGGEPRKLIAGAVEADWSPDGKQIVFLRVNNPVGEIMTIAGVLTIADGAIKQIASLKGLFGFPRWSADGRYVAMVGHLGGGVVGASHKDLLLLSLDGAQRTIASPFSGGEISAPAWAENGLIYSQPESSSVVSLNENMSSSSASRVVLQEIDSHKTRILFTNQVPISSVEVVAPGRVMFGVVSLRKNLKEFSLGAGAEPAGKPPATWLTHGSSVDRQPFYSPLGDWVLFTSNRSGNNDIWEVSTKVGTIRRLTDNEADDWDPAMTPDGKHLVWSSNRSGHFEIWMADADGSAAHQVSNDGFDAENPTASADGWVVYASGNPEKRGVWKVRWDGSQATQLKSGMAAWPDISPDGKYVLFHLPPSSGFGAAFDSQIRVASMADGALQPFNFFGARARWMPDGKAIAFQSRTSNNGTTVYTQDFPPSTNAKRTLGSVEPGETIDTFEISPDGKRMIISLTDITRSLVMADGVAGVSPAPKMVK